MTNPESANGIKNAKAAAERGEFELAVTLLRPLAESGEPDAQYELGFLGLTECDLITGREAFSLFQSAANQGHAAMYHLATFPEFVNGPFKSPLSEKEAWSWLIRSAESGCAQAQYDAGAFLASGDWGDGDASRVAEIDARRPKYQGPRLRLRLGCGRSPDVS
jgi:TPR repeat protein